MGARDMRCNFCNFHSPNEENFYDLFSFRGAIRAENSIKLLKEFAESGGRTVTFCGSGECTIHRGHVEICRAARAAGPRPGLITDGSRPHRDDLAQCVIDTHTWARVGLNASTEETFTRSPRIASTRSRRSCPRSACARRVSTARRTSCLTTLIYTGLLLGPVLIGWSAEAIGLTATLLTLLILLLGVTLNAGSTAVADRTPAEAA